MTRFNTIHVLIGSAIILAAIGCGDASSFDTTDPFAEDAFPTDDTTPTIDDELALVCEAFCDAASECRGTFGTEECIDSCVSRYAAGAEDDDCIAAEIDLLNCYSAQTCDESPLDLRRECGAAVARVEAACGARLRRVDAEEDSGLEVVEVVELGDHEWIDADGDAEETETTDGSDDEESDETGDTGPVIIPDLPDFPEFPEIPEIGPIFDFP